MNTQKSLILISLIILQLSSLYIFSKGFFVFKIPINERANISDYPLYQGRPVSIKRQFDRLVLVMVDALRHDLAFSKESGFEFVKRQDALNLQQNQRSISKTFCSSGASTNGDHAQNQGYG